MLIKALKCECCKTIIFSRARHDYRSCACGAIAIDGGFDYQKVCWKPGTDYTAVEVDVDATAKELYEDWNLGLDRYGLIPEGE
jgi:hypothetical protein